MNTKIICLVLLLTFALLKVLLAGLKHGDYMEVNFWSQLFAFIVKVLLYAGIGAFSL
jgi:hypothetical protein